MSHFVGNRWPAALLLAVVMPSLRVDRNRVRSRVVSHVAALIGFTLLAGLMQTHQELGISSPGIHGSVGNPNQLLLGELSRNLQQH